MSPRKLVILSAIRRPPYKATVAPNIYIMTCYELSYLAEQLAHSARASYPKGLNLSNSIYSKELSALSSHTSESNLLRSALFYNHVIKINPPAKLGFSVSFPCLIVVASIMMSLCKYDCDKFTSLKAAKCCFHKEHCGWCLWGKKRVWISFQYTSNSKCWQTFNQPE